MFCRTRLPILLLTVTLTACGGSGGAPDAQPASSQAVESISARPWLRERLPADTIGYVRVPSPWGLFAAPNGKAADAMFASDAHVEAVARIRAGFAENPILAKALGSDAADRYIRAVNAVAAPIEAAVIDPGRAATPATQVLVSTVLRERDPERLGVHLSTLFGDGGEPSAPVFDDDGYGTLSLPGMPALPFHLDRSNGRLHMLAGMNPSSDQLRRLLDDITGTQPRAHALHTLENEIDAGGQGLLVWLDVRAMRPWMAAGSGGDSTLRAAYEPVQALAFGWGSVNGHGRLSLRAQVDNPTWLRYLPQAPRRLDVGSSGKPGFVVSLALPTADDVDRILAAVAEDHGEDMLNDWHAFETMIESWSGLSIRDWLRPFGPELVFFNDEAGFFSAIRLHDRAAFARVIENVVGHGGEHRTRRIAGTDIHHLSFRIGQPLLESEGASLPGMNLLGWWQGLPEHTYWVEEGDWLISATVPQPLIDRAVLGRDQDLQRWSDAEFGDDRSRALLSASTHSRDLARWYYHLHLTLLARLGDIAGTPVDLFDLPSARQLQLPRDTGVGLQLVADHERIAIDLNYEITPIDGVLSIGGGYTAIAAAGILAAIAVPAYQDYTSRAVVNQAIAAAAPLRLTITEHYMAHGTLPRAQDLAHLLDPQPAGVPAQILFEAGAIRIRFTEEASAALAGSQLYLRPYADDHGQLHFVCGQADAPYSSQPLIEDLDASATTVATKQLPASCRP